MQSEWSTAASDGDGGIGGAPSDDDAAVSVPTGAAVDPTGEGTDPTREEVDSTEAEAHRSAVDAVDDLLDEVELALARLDDGTYGRCEECGAPIDDLRLEGSPIVRTCGTCVIGGSDPDGSVAGRDAGGVTPEPPAAPVGLSAATGPHGG